MSCKISIIPVKIFEVFISKPLHSLFKFHHVEKEKKKSNSPEKGRILEKLISCQVKEQIWIILQRTRWLLSENFNNLTEIINLSIFISNFPHSTRSYGVREWRKFDIFIGAFLLS